MGSRTPGAGSGPAPGVPPAPPFDDLVARALAEDLGVEPERLLAGHAGLLARDVTTHATAPAGARFSGRVVARSAGVACGIAVAARAWTLLAEAAGVEAGALTVEPLAAEGERVEPRTPVLAVDGPVGVVLTAERTALNALMTLSGIASETARWVAAAPGVAVCDTRKTLPGLRALSKWAVVCGGGHPHRAGLWDMVLIKDNHIRMAGGISAAVDAARATHPRLAVEVEADTIEQAEEAVRAGVDIVLLDNMDPATLTRAVEAVRVAAKATGATVSTEASGGIGFADLAEVARTGVDRVSTSALTLAPPLDFGFDEVTTGG